MGALSKLGGCLSSFGSVLTNRRTRLRFVVGLTAVRHSHARQHVLPLCERLREQGESTPLTCPAQTVSWPCCTSPSAGA